MPPEQKLALDEVVWVDPERMSGAPCFRGTRVPVQTLIDHWDGGSTLDDFLEDLPSVKPGQVVAPSNALGVDCRDCALNKCI